MISFLDCFSCFRIRNSDANSRAEDSATLPVAAGIIRASNAGYDLAPIASGIEPPRGDADNFHRLSLENVQGSTWALTRGTRPLRSEPTRINTFGTANSNQPDSQLQIRLSRILVVRERQVRDLAARLEGQDAQAESTEAFVSAILSFINAAERPLVQTIDKCAITAGELLQHYPNIERVKLPITLDVLGADPDLKIVLMMDGEIVNEGLLMDGYRIYEADDLKKCMETSMKRSPVSRKVFDSNSVARLQDEKIVDARGKPLDLTKQLLS